MVGGTDSAKEGWQPQVPVEGSVISGISVALNQLVVNASRAGVSLPRAGCLEAAAELAHDRFSPREPVVLLPVSEAEQLYEAIVEVLCCQHIDEIERLMSGPAWQLELERNVLARGYSSFFHHVSFLTRHLRDAMRTAVDG